MEKLSFNTYYVFIDLIKHQCKYIFMIYRLNQKIQDIRYWDYRYISPLML